MAQSIRVSEHCLQLKNIYSSRVDCRQKERLVGLSSSFVDSVALMRFDAVGISHSLKAL